MTMAPAGDTPSTRVRSDEGVTNGGQSQESLGSWHTQPSLPRHPADCRTQAPGTGGPAGSLQNTDRAPLTPIVAYVDVAPNEGTST